MLTIGAYVGRCLPPTSPKRLTGGVYVVAARCRRKWRIEKWKIVASSIAGTASGAKAAGAKFISSR